MSDYQKYKESHLKAQKKYDDKNREKKREYDKKRWQERKAKYQELEQLQKDNKKYKEVIEKAIEYMKNNATSNYFDKEKNMFRREEDLLKILKEVE